MKTKLSRQQVLAQKLYNGNGLFPNELKEYKELVAQDAAKKNEYINNLNHSIDERDRKLEAYRNEINRLKSERVSLAKWILDLFYDRQVNPELVVKQFDKEKQ